MRHYLFRGCAAAAATDKRKDAEGAAIVAAILDLEIGTGAIASRMLHGRREEIVLGENITNVNVAMIGSGFARADGDEVGDLRLMGITHDPLHPGTPASSAGARWA